MIIVIDGPAGSGKSTTARAVADKLKIEYLDSGALYRTVTLVYLEAGRDDPTFFRLLKQKKISFRYANKQFDVRMDGKPVTDKLRMADVVKYVSEVAAKPKVRAFVNGLMRKTVHDGIYIAEGRDLGTAVFPDADLKFFMSAKLGERARRRYKERKAINPDITLEEVEQNILQRDQKDSKRKADPLKKADDAIEVDTTNVTFEQQVEQIASKVKHLMQS
ncbi:MAG TPA: (d)CMP kinase [Balneolaceae bacterium]|nr:(d)CMP kinase [Balneolaceae bacterium]